MKKKKETKTSLRNEDLQKQLKKKSSALEKSKRELKIEAALEHVRARTMAMQKSDELAGTVSILFKQLLALGIKKKQMRTCAIVTLKPNEPIGECWITKPDGEIIPHSFMVPYDETSAYKNIYAAWKKGEKFLLVHLSGDALQQHLNFLKKYANIPTQQFQASPDQPRETYTHAMFFSQGYLFIISNEALPGYHEIFKRFGAVFQQTYTRFLDLQKAEAQARESQIQLALERVRARTMAMQRSDELGEAASLLFKQIADLGTKQWSSGFDIWNVNEVSAVAWMSNPDGSMGIPFTVPYTEDPFFKQIYEARQSGKDFFVMESSGKELEETYQYLFNLPEAKKHFDGVESLGFQMPKFQITHCAFFSQGYLMFITFEAAPEMWDIFKRFAKVFEQTYTRFLDLQKAEAQAREAQIEAALERVRSRTMAMHKSEELAETAVVLFQQFSSLGVVPARLYIGIVRDDPGNIELWATDEGGNKISTRFTGNMAKSDTIGKMYKGWIEKKKSLVLDLQGMELENYVRYMYEELNIPFTGGLSQSRRVQSLAYFSNGCIGLVTPELQSTETLNLLERFAAVFNLTYTRFLDLQKAETQAREAQIELSLERVRAKTMAMHNSQGVANTVATMFDELVKLGIDKTTRFGIAIIGEKDDMELWTASSKDNGQIGLDIGRVGLTIHPLMKGFHEAWKNKKTDYTYELTGADLKDYFSSLNASPEYPVQFDLQTVPSKLVHSSFFFPEGALYAFSPEPLTTEASKIFNRFAAVFGQTYRRYLDLQKAETQAREAQIELSLERVRAKTMAMHNSKDVGDTVATLFDEFVKLGITTNRCGILIHSDSPAAEVWTAKANTGGAATLIIGQLDTSIHPMLTGVREAWKNKESFFSYELKGEDIKKYYRAINDEKYYPTQFDLSNLPAKEFHSDFYFAEGCIFAFTAEPIPSEAAIIFKRFAGVFGQTYRRYLDLKKAEAQARSAQIEAAMEKVRARSLAMQKPEELIEVAEVLRKEMGSLGVEELETSSIYIVDGTTGTAECWYAIKDIREEDKKLVSDHMIINLHDTWVGREMQKFYSSNKKQVSILMQGENRKEWINYCAAHSKVLQGYYGDEIPERTYHLVKFSNGYMGAASPGNISAENWDLLHRATAVFSFAFTRFLDLQKAEAQTREAQIELALERVRARTMAMFKSDELAETVVVVFKQLIGLGIAPNRLYIAIINYDSGDLEFWITDEEGDKMSSRYIVNVNKNISIKKMYEGWASKKKSICIDMQGKELEAWLNYWKEEFHVPFKPGAALQRRVQNIAYFSKGFIAITSPDDQPESTVNLLERFAAVFNLTYTRFSDLQQAEEQAKEAQIEAALERVRSKAMAMHKSEDLSSAASTVFTELRKLGINPIRSGVGLLTKENRKAMLYGATTSEKGDDLSLVGWVTLEDHPIFAAQYEKWLSHEDYFAVLENEEIKKYYEKLSVNFSVPVTQSNEKQYGYFLMFAHGFLFCWSQKAYEEAEVRILKRFASVIDLTFKRYFDLQKAEAQTREAQIEASLERVRARTMAMHSSDDVTSATATMFIELEKLGIENVRGGITIISDNQTMEVWGVTNIADGKTVKGAGVFNMNAHPLWQQLFKAWKNKDESFIGYLAGKEKEDYTKIINSTPGYLSQPLGQLPEMNFQSYFFGQGAIWTFSLQPHSEEDKQVMKRFASVFSLTFRRYQDLQKAEAQAREATIEAALEKVRGKAMAMHNSNDLSSTASIVFTELRKLGINPIRCGVGLLNKESRKAQLYSATSSTEEDSLSLIGWVMLSGHPVMENIYETWLRNEDYFPELVGDQLRNYYELLLKGLPVAIPDSQRGQKQYGTFLSISIGCLYAWSEAPYNETEIKILKRFASIIDLTFRRYIELQKSEANAREAVKQAALDRVRADIASMRSISDLDRITPLIWNELTVLGIPFIRCGVFIMDDSQKLIHTFLSTPDGKAIAAFHLPYDTPGNFTEMVTRWHSKQIYIDHWGDAEFISIADTLVKQAAIATREQYLNSLPHGGFYLHFLPFLQGMLYVGNTTRLHDDEISLIQSVADAFSTAYARYEDFNKLEAAKQTVEKTLVDLKQAQTQLVQSEKMASLGELTAGIAHEIQNPLNFVNNFSEVSNELIDEMNEELDKGDIDEAKAIAHDIKQNLEKINHHGKRADGIVKGMLQHSRTSTGQKELTDINVLTDEYLRLCYHGLRAKDKSFNAIIKTDFDNTIEKINIIPQDIGRVLLNLYNNAFYAVSEKKKSAGADYEPIISVSTKKIDNKIAISVRDNGNGIPQKVVDKIFQPFFTTKPTGQGTGLGLSLSYDIVKTHGGEIKVETKENEGTTFTIQLPTAS